MQIVRESIFVSAIRSFFNTLLAVLGLLIAIVIVGILATTLTPPYRLDDDFIEMQILPDAKGDAVILPETAPVILQIDISGIIGMDHLTGESIETFLRAARKGVMKKDRIKGILLYIDSPGGSAVDSDRIYQAIMRYKTAFQVPVYAYTPSFCASGGYMIACSADQIYASPSSIVGSIGVKWGLGFNFWQFMQTHGISSVTLTEGLYKEKYPMFSKAAEDTSSYNDLIAIMKDSYTQFIEIVAKARETHGLSATALRETYGAQVYLGPTAEKNGYVDHGSAYYSDALSDLAKEAHIDTTAYQVLRFNYKPSPLQDLVKGKLSLWLEETRNALLGIKSHGRFDNTLLYYYDSQDRIK